MYDCVCVCACMSSWHWYPSVEMKIDSELWFLSVSTTHTHTLANSITDTHTHKNMTNRSITINHRLHNKSALFTSHCCLTDSRTEYDNEIMAGGRSNETTSTSHCPSSREKIIHVQGRKNVNVVLRQSYILTRWIINCAPTFELSQKLKCQSHISLISPKLFTALKWVNCLPQLMGNKMSFEN